LPELDRLVSFISASNDTNHTCLRDCECPCNWKYGVNYTDEELIESVRKIQEKLKLTKEGLSKTVCVIDASSFIFSI